MPFFSNKSGDNLLWLLFIIIQFKWAVLKILTVTLMMLWQCFLVTSELRSEVVINKVIDWLNILAIPWGRSLLINGGGVGAVGIFSLCPDKTYLIPHKTEIFEWSTSLAVNILAGDDWSSLVPPENHVFPQNTISPHSPPPPQPRR